MTAQRILLAEDEEFVADLLAMRLRGAGYEVDILNDGRMVEPTAAAQPPDLLLCDIWLPGRDGLQVIQSLVASGARFPIIAMTASRYGAETRRAMELGAVAALHKPFGFEVLLATVRDHLGGGEVEGAPAG